MFTSAKPEAGPRRRRGGAATALACALMSGCMVGPNFTPPAPPKLDRYPDQGVPGKLEGDGANQTVELGRPADSHWWRLFGSAALDRLVDGGLAASPTLASAREALAGARDQARAGAGAFFPNLGASAAATNERLNPAEFGQEGPGRTFTLYTSDVSVSYALDLFGGQRRQVEALNAQAGYQRNAVGAAWLLLTGGIVEAAIARAAYADEAATLTVIVKLDQDQQDVLTAEVTAGYAPLTAELAAEEQEEADAQSLVVVRQRLAASATLLSRLMGREPAETTPPAPALAELSVPPAAPVSLPSQLIHQRPDILEAEATLHQASAEVGVATAALFPSISITGDYGVGGVSLASLAGPAARFWNVGPSVTIPIFHGGALWYGRKAAQASYLKAAADYRQTVLAALEQTADALKALDADAQVAASSRAVYDAAELTSAKLDEANRSAGTIAEFDAMTGQIATGRARLVLVAAKAQRLQDVVALYLACGGGWNGRDPGGGGAAEASR